MSIVVRKPALLLALREEVKSVISILKGRRSEIQEYFMSQQVIQHSTAKKTLLSKTKKHAEIQSEDYHHRGLLAGEAIYDLLNDIYRNLRFINIFLQRCTPTDFYDQVGKMAEYVDRVSVFFKETEKSQLKYKDIQQKKLKEPGFVQKKGDKGPLSPLSSTPVPIFVENKTYLRALKDLAVSVIGGTIKTRDLLMKKVSQK